MTQRRQRKTASRYSCPATTHSRKIDTPADFNPEFQHLTAKKMSLTSNTKRETYAPTPEMLRQVLEGALEMHFGDSFGDFVLVCKRWIVGEWRETRMDLQSRLSKISYLAPTLAFESFGIAEKELRVEWRKTKLLRGLSYLWAHAFLALPLTSLQQANSFYIAFCRTFAAVSYSLFAGCFRIMEEKGVDVMGRLLRNTAVSIVTQLKEWRQIYATCLEPFIFAKYPMFTENFDLSTLNEVNPKVFNVNSMNSFPQTASAIESLAKCLTFDSIVAHLHSFRNCLMKQMLETIEFEAKRQGRKSALTQKDDVLGCISYTLVRYKLDGVGCLLAYLEFLLGNHIDEALRDKSVDLFKIDLEAAYWRVSEPVVKIPYSPPQGSF